MQAVPCCLHDCMSAVGALKLPCQSLGKVGGDAYSSYLTLPAEVAELGRLCRPSSLAEAQRIPGVTPAALLLLLLHVRRRGGKQPQSGRLGEHESRRARRARSRENGARQLAPA